MIKSLVRENWLLTEISSLFIDDQDYFGIEYWYNDIKKVNDSLKHKK